MIRSGVVCRGVLKGEATRPVTETHALLREWAMLPLPGADGADSYAGPVQALKLLLKQ